MSCLHAVDLAKSLPGGNVAGYEDGVASYLAGLILSEYYPVENVAGYEDGVAAYSTDLTPRGMP